MTTSVLAGVTVDGYPARPNGDLDLPPVGGGEPHGYHEFMASVETKRVLVPSNWAVDLWAVGGRVEQTAALRLRLLRDWRRAARSTSTSTEASPFQDFCAQTCSSV